MRSSLAFCLLASFALGNVLTRNTWVSFARFYCHFCQYAQQKTLLKMNPVNCSEEAQSKSVPTERIPCEENKLRIGAHLREMAAKQEGFVDFELDLN
jgi:hypothetical protein